MFEIKVKCCECRAWERDGPDGTCVRNAPSPSCLPICEQGYTLAWPRTEADKGCFEGIPVEVKN